MTSTRFSFALALCLLGGSIGCNAFLSGDTPASVNSKPIALMESTA